ncbi:hypothetical protein [Rummeliibacillus sp. TYF-LIM-RU47]|uniref:hypothetical protein n=1 Tax=Rummeliibacillus sp. TYF-LIM-RU47 TaxID=2608406 RepID=UPI00123BE5AA|nr:hypothetical protein [Rummeliibacillus sp. TYF-LIM-RU47]
MIKGAVEHKDLDRHISNLRSNEKLKNLTLDQAEAVALMMEHSYREGKNESTEIKSCTINITIAVNPCEIKEQISKAFSDLAANGVTY